MIDKMKMVLLVELGEPRNAGEVQLKRYLRMNNYIVEDVSDNCHYWKKDIDFIVYYPNSQDSFSAEVKWDGLISKTGNLFLEILTDVDKKKDGWFNFCQADYIYYGDAVKRLFYKINTQKLKQWVQENKDGLIIRYASDIKQGVLLKQSKGYLVPLESIKTLVEETIDLRETYEIFRDL